MPHAANAGAALLAQAPLLPRPRLLLTALLAAQVAAQARGAEEAPLEVARGGTMFRVPDCAHRDDRRLGLLRGGPHLPVWRRGCGRRLLCEAMQQVWQQTRRTHHQAWRMPHRVHRRTVNRVAQHEADLPGTHVRTAMLRLLLLSLFERLPSLLLPLLVLLILLLELDLVQLEVEVLDINLGGEPGLHRRVHTRRRRRRGGLPRGRGARLQIVRGVGQQAQQPGVCGSARTEGHRTQELVIVRSDTLLAIP
mmetsp:Transcript_63906/g.208401  ORF Transcript_63906/g.208401 Transcript_63906/m.208401 type:complete len:251 (+) Transcript_63906:359-1111(+)